MVTYFSFSPISSEVIKWNLLSWPGFLISSNVILLIFPEKSHFLWFCRIGDLKEKLFKGSSLFSLLDVTHQGIAYYSILTFSPWGRLNWQVTHGEGADLSSSTKFWFHQGQWRSQPPQLLLLSFFFSPSICKKSVYGSFFTFGWTTVPTQEINRLPEALDCNSKRGHLENLQLLDVTHQEKREFISLFMSFMLQIFNKRFMWTM